MTARVRTAAALAVMAAASAQSSAATAAAGAGAAGGASAATGAGAAGGVPAAARGANAAGGARTTARGAGVAGGAPAAARGAAAQGVGSLTVTISARADRALDLGATGNASRRGRTVTLPLASADASGLRTGGALVLKRGKRSVTLASPRLELGARPRVTALLAGKRSTVLTLAVAPLTSARGVTLEATSAALTGAAGKAIEQRLRTKLRRTAFASVAASAAFAQAEPPTGPCVTTNAGGTPVTPGDGEPPVKARPAGARTITSATLTWRPRESFVQYINSGEGTSTVRGATSDPPEVAGGSDAPLVYSFHFPFAEGWCDPATGAARVAFTGTVAFKYADHEIDLRVNDPEVELDGPASRVIFRMTGSGDTNGGNQRAVVETLDVSKAAITAAAPSFAYERIPGAVPPGAATSVFAGYYLPGDPFGWVSISFTTD
ncbi:HtaA domain-containing protein [Solirubrobacter soli]|uniref:HtaA domain-containing protein n=1 Tax=Solirubrobacter soli TaxID=363832 RepID=UPI0004897364|nr:HtaA domain-containing protein [Solirubrobacter soli]